MAATSDGVFGKDIFFLVVDDPTATSPTPSAASSAGLDCCNDFTYKVYANDSGKDYENDKKDFNFVLNALFVSAVLTLQKFDDDINDWADVVTLGDNTYGTFFPFAFFTSQKSERYIGYLLEFSIVLANHGIGSYRVKCVGTLATTGTVSIYTDTYCLFFFIPDLVDGTVRFEYYRNGFVGNESDDEKVMEWGNLNFYGQTRLPGFFSFENEEGTKKNIRYENGQENWTEDEKTLNWIFRSKQLFWAAHKLLKTDVMQSDKLFVTDYNVDNIDNFVKKKVKSLPGYKPEFNYIRSKLAPVEIRFINEYNNFKKFRS